ncbi:Pre-mRNA-splicing factor cwf19 [Dipsacomyces acuminosporus]|nr:Pre-mRNA-splicing factor cwf19 [Dipsacomyces acuminosporus]
MDLNRLRAKVMKARMTKSADLADLEQQLAAAMAGTPISGSRDSGSSSGSNVVVLPRVDSHGRLLKLGEAKSSSKSKDKEKDDSLSIMQMARMERETRGDDSMDRALAKQIIRDSGFSNDLGYIDDNMERLSKQKGEKTEEQKRQAAIRDYKIMESVLGNCDLCFKQSQKADGSTLLTPPDYPVVALGNRVYLALPNREPMSDGHCLIAPIEHIAGSSLKCDDDMWDEIHNFMKCLMRMLAMRGQSAVFLETVMSTNPSRAQHCVIECIPIPMSRSADAPGYFKEGLLSSDDEWSQHRKVISTAVKLEPVAPENDNVRDQDDNHKRDRELIRRGGFRNTMTAKMPYFHVWFDPHGGMGHVIENPDRFPPWFGREVVAGMLDLPPAVYRKPRRLKETQSQQRDRVEGWKKQFDWDRFDWTKMLS